MAILCLLSTPFGTDDSLGQKSLLVCVNVALDGRTGEASQSCHPIHAEVIPSGRGTVPGDYNTIFVGRHSNHLI
jgi:hypothetical protein